MAPQAKLTSVRLRLTLPVRMMCRCKLGRDSTDYIQWTDNVTGDFLRQQQ